MKKSTKTYLFYLDYCNSVIFQQEHTVNAIQEAGTSHFKWYPYSFSLEKSDDDVSFSTKCYKNKAIDIQESLLNRWKNLEQIKKDAKNIAHLLGFI